MSDGWSDSGWRLRPLGISVRGEAAVFSAIGPPAETAAKTNTVTVQRTLGTL